MSDALFIDGRERGLAKIVSSFLKVSVLENSLPETHWEAWD